MSTIEATRPQVGALSPADAAAYLGIGRSTLYALVRGGDLRLLKIGTRSVIARDALDAYLSRLTEQSSKATH